MHFFTDHLTPGGVLKLTGFVLAIAALLAGPWRRISSRGKAEAAPLMVGERRSFLGRVGSALAAHAVLSVATGIIGLPFITTILCYFCASVIWICGGTATMPTSVMAGPRAAWGWVKSELKEVAGAARPVMDEKKEAAARAVEEARKAASDAARRIDEAKREAAEAIAEKKREAALAALKLRDAEQAAAAKIKEVERSSAARVQEAKDLADKASSLAKMAGALKGFGLPGLGGKSSEQVALERERFEEQKLELDWRSYRESEPLSKMTIQEFRRVREIGCPPASWEFERLQRARWRAWNAGIDLR